jgi:hypothetical protein
MPMQSLLPSVRRQAVGLYDHSITGLNPFTCVAA